MQIPKDVMDAFEKGGIPSDVAAAFGQNDVSSLPSWDEIKSDKSFQGMSDSDRSSVRDRFLKNNSIDLNSKVASDFYAATKSDITTPDKPFYSDMYEIGRQIASGVVVGLPRMAGQAAEALSPKQSGISDYGKSMVTSANERAKGYTPDMQGRGIIASTLIKGATSLVPSVVTMATYAVPVIGEVFGPVATIALLGGSAYQEEYDKMKAKGKSDEDANKAGLITGLIQGGGEAVANRLSLGIFGLGKNAAKTSGELIGKEIGKKEIAKSFGKALAKTAGAEITTEVAQDVATAKVEQSFGLKTNSLMDIAKESGQATLGMTVLLGALGTPFHYKAGKQAQAINEVLNNPDTPEQGRRAVVDMIHQQAKKLKITDADQWYGMALQDIADNSPIRRSIDEQPADVNNTDEQPTNEGNASSLSDQLDAAANPVQQQADQSQVDQKDINTRQTAEAYPDLVAQKEAVKDGRKPAMLVSDGAESPLETDGLQAVPVENYGTLLTGQEVTKGKIAGIPVLNPDGSLNGQVLGMASQVKPADDSEMVTQALDANNNIVLEEVGQSEEAAQAAQQVAGEGGQVRVIPIEQALQEREQRRQEDLQSLNQPAGSIQEEKVRRARLSRLQIEQDAQSEQAHAEAVKAAQQVVSDYEEVATDGVYQPTLEEQQQYEQALSIVGHQQDTSINGRVQTPEFGDAEAIAEYDAKLEKGSIAALNKSSAAKRRHNEKTTPNTEVDSLTDFVAKHGGFRDNGGETKTLEGANSNVFGVNNLINNKSKNTRSDMLEMAREAGYPIPENDKDFAQHLKEEGNKTFTAAGHDNQVEIEQAKIQEKQHAEDIAFTKSMGGDDYVTSIISSQDDRNKAIENAQGDDGYIFLDGDFFAADAVTLKDHKEIDNESNNQDFTKEGKNIDGQTGKETGGQDGQSDNTQGRDNLPGQESFLTAEDQSNTENSLAKESNKEYHIDGIKEGGIYEVKEQLNLPLTRAGKAGNRSETGRRKPRVSLRKTGEIKTGTTVVRSAADAAHLIASLRKEAQENLGAVVMDSEGNVLVVIQHTIGVSNASQVSVGLLAGSIASVPNAKSYYIVHNHPSGTAELSKQDISVFNRTTTLTSAAGIRGMDILAVTHGGKFASSSESNTTIPAKNRIKSVTVKVRRITGQSLGRAITDPDRLADAVKDIARGKTGVILADHSYTPTAFVEMGMEDMAAIKGKDSAKEYLAAIHDGNATNQFAVIDGKTDASLNMQSIGNAAGVITQDVFDMKTNTSLMEEGRHDKTRGDTYFYSKGRATTGQTVAETKKSLIKQFGVSMKRAIAKGRVVIHRTAVNAPEGVKNAVLFNGSHERIDSIKSGGVFDGVFASFDMEVAHSHGSVINKFHVQDDKIADSHDLEDADPDLVKKIILDNIPYLGEEHIEVIYENAVSERNERDAQYIIMEALGEDDGGSSWDLQRIRGTVARELGYEAVEIDDEHGTSYLITPLHKITAKFSKDGSIQGWYDKDGTINIVAENNDTDSLAGVVLHEAKHAFDDSAKGQAILEKSIKQIKLAKELAKSGRGKVAEWITEAEKAIPSDTPAKDYYHEIFAYAVQQYHDNMAALPNTIKNIAKRYVDALTGFIRAHLLKAGIPIKVTPAAMASLARSELNSMGKREGVFSGETAYASAAKVANPDIRYSKTKKKLTSSQQHKKDAAILKAQNQPIESRDAWNLKETWKEKLEAKTLYRFNRIKKLGHHIYGKKLPDGANAAEDEALFYGKIGDEFKKMERKHIKPATNILAKSGMVLDDLEQFMYANHAPEVNAVVKKMDAKNDKGSGITDQEAKKILDGYSPEQTKALTEASGFIRSMLDHRLDLMVEHGLETKEFVDMLRKKYPNYVPLSGNENDQSIVAMITGKKFDIRGKETKARVGRYSKAVDLIPNAINQAQATAIRAHKATVGRSIAQMYLANQDSNIWDLNSIPVRKYVSKAGQIFDGSEKQLSMYDTEETTSDGKIVYRVDPSWKQKDNVFAFKVDAKQYFLTIHDEALARQLKGLGVEQGGVVVNALGRLNRGLATVYTSMSPEFVITNAMRDIQTALMNLQAHYDHISELTEKDLKGLKRKVLKGWGKSLMTVLRDELESKSTGAYQEKWERYQKAGGKVSFFSMQDADGLRANIDREIKLATKGKHLTLKTFIKIAKYVQGINAAVENAVRLSTFVALTDVGVSDKDAAYIGRNLTVDFNRKGESAALANALFLFYNASIQGSRVVVNATRMMAKSGKGQAAIASMIATGFVLAEITRQSMGQSDDDRDKWDAIPDYKKQRNLIYPTASGYGTFMLPYGFSLFPNTGYWLNDLYHYYNSNGHQGKSPMHVSVEMVKSILNSYNPIGGDDLPLPTVLKPGYELLTNEDYANRPINKQQSPYAKYKKPDSETYYHKYDHSFEHAIASALNRTTGGDDVKPGFIDIGPGTINYWVKFATGGMGNFISSTGNILSKSVSGDEIKGYEVPFYRKLSSSIPDYSSVRDYRENIQDPLRRYDEWRHASGGRKSELVKSYSNEIKLGRIANLRERAMRRQYKNRKAAGENKDRVNDINKKIQDIATKYNKTYYSIMGVK